MGRRTERAARPIDDAFWEALEKCQPECLIYGSILCDDDHQAGEELFKEALDAILDGSRPWREGSELVAHIKGCMRSLAWNDRVNQSALKLRELKADRDPEPIAKQPTPQQQAMNNEKNARLAKMCDELARDAKPGTLEHRFWQEVMKGVFDLDDIAHNLGVSRDAIRDLMKRIHEKAEKLLQKHGYRMEADDDSEDFESPPDEEDEYEMEAESGEEP